MMEIIFFVTSGLFFYWGLLKMLRQRGIYHPIYPIIMSTVMLLLSICIRIGLYIIVEDEYYFITCSYVDLTAVVIIYCIGKNVFPDIQHRVIKKVFSKINYHILATLFFVIGIIHIVSTAFLTILFFEYEDTFMALYYIGSACIVMLIIYIYWSLEISRYEKLRHETERTIESLTTQRAPILFLRSFELDKYLVFNKSFDEYICRNFSLTAQPIVSLCDPDSFLPTGGSIKIQSLDDKWKDAIAVLFQTCRAVVIFEGRSSGLRWEIANIKRYIKPDQLFIVTPPFSYRMRAWMQVQTLFIPFQLIFNRKEIKRIFHYVWSNFANHLTNEGIYLHDNTPNSSTVISFNDQWREIGSKKIKGVHMFDYILNMTVKYETRECDYTAVVNKLEEYTLHMTFTKEEKRKINNALLKVSIMIIIVYVTIFMLLYIIFL